MHPPEQSGLLRLPVELQIVIFKLAVVEDEPLLVNCACDSSYPGDWETWTKERTLWSTGEKRPPMQPALTLTCTTARNIALPLFYKHNVFRAHYCYQADFAIVIKWLKRIGLENRRLLHDFCLIDMNPWFDQQIPTDHFRVKESEVFRGLGGSMYTMAKDDCCCHRITFGDEDEDYYELVPPLFEE